MCSATGSEICNEWTQTNRLRTAVGLHVAFPLLCCLHTCIKSAFSSIVLIASAIVYMVITQHIQFPFLLCLNYTWSFFNILLTSWILPYLGSIVQVTVSERHQQFTKTYDGLCFLWRYSCGKQVVSERHLSSEQAVKFVQKGCSFIFNTFFHTKCMKWRDTVCAFARFMPRTVQHVS